MKILCAWCGKVIGGRGAALSHGICRPCFQDFFQGRFAFLDAIPLAAAPARRVRVPVPNPGRKQQPWMTQLGLFEGGAF